MPRVKTPVVENGWTDITDDIVNKTVVVIGSDKDDYKPPVEDKEDSEA